MHVSPRHQASRSRNRRYKPEAEKLSWLRSSLGLIAIECLISFHFIIFLELYLHIFIYTIRFDTSYLPRSLSENPSYLLIGLIGNAGK